MNPRQIEVLTAMIERAGDSSAPEPITVATRQGWLAQVARTTIAGRCRCGTCPTIDLAVDGVEPDSTRSTRIVLTAGSRDGLLLLFIDDDRLSCLELAPLEPDSRIEEFPPVAEIDFS